MKVKGYTKVFSIEGKENFSFDVVDSASYDRSCCELGHV
jgi:hypothetical protein